MSIRAGQGIQVVNITSGHSYQLNEAALERILLRDEIKDLRVVVVSVAGAYRGGKSFLLDFFLRYLYATQNNNGINDWLGTEDEPLVGFSWCGGSERNTTGLLLWSEPIRATLPSGEQVAVVLMDTQGTFDSRSTMRDCSTIFALSTLISSVQIYNISQNINEDYLQHLQLFTEYGRMASNDVGKPFQALRFLVRDWNYPYEHPYGADGGERLLQNRLQIDSDQAEELQEIRQHIHSCFDTVDCFLMPHPGLAVVTDPNFNGRLSDISGEFKKSLRELVPSIFAPTKLKLKSINGHPVKARELVYYFKTYVNEFNSNKLPTPLTIMKAMGEACMLSAISEARQEYRAAMEATCGVEQPSVPAGELRALHRTARDAALRTFAAKKKMGAQHAADSHSAQLTQEIDEQYSQYELMNFAKTQRAISSAKRAYEEFVQSVSAIENLCLHPTVLRDVHHDAVEDAMRIFDSKRRAPQDGEDDEKSNLMMDLQERYRQLITLNEQNNNAAVLEAREDYFSLIENVCGGQPCMGIQELQLQHEEALARALDVFKSKRSRNIEHDEDIYISHLTKEIELRYGSLQTKNVTNNKSAVDSAISVYGNFMGSICSFYLPCLHPEDLSQEHEEAKQRALNEFYSRRRFGGNDDAEDEYIRTIHQELDRKYVEFRQLNQVNNDNAVEAALNEYCNAMQAVCGLGRLRLSDEALQMAHEHATAGAMQLFRNKRRQGAEHNTDRHRSNLNKSMEERLEHYTNVNAQNPEVNVVVGQEARESSMLETVAVVAGSAALAAGVVAAVVASGGLAAAGAAAGTAVTTEGVAAAAATAAGVAATVAATTWNFTKNIFNRFRRQD